MHSKKSQSPFLSKKVFAPLFFREKKPSPSFLVEKKTALSSPLPYFHMYITENPIQFPWFSRWKIIKNMAKNSRYQKKNIRETKPTQNLSCDRFVVWWMLKLMFTFTFYRKILPHKYQYTQLSILVIISTLYPL